MCVGVYRRLVRVGLDRSVALGHGLCHGEDDTGDQDDLESDHEDEVPRENNSYSVLPSSLCLRVPCVTACVSLCPVFILQSSAGDHCSVHTWAGRSAAAVINGTFCISPDRH